MGGRVGECAIGHVWRLEDALQEEVWVSGIELELAALAASTFTNRVISPLLTLVLTKFSQLFGPFPSSSQMLLLEGRCVFHLPPRGTQHTVIKSSGPKVNPSIHLAFWSQLYTVAVSELLGGRSTLRLHTGPGT